MKKRLTAMIVCVLLVLSFFPATALAAYTYPSGIYNENDYNKLKAFLDQTSADGVHTNGWQLGGDAYGADPSTWGTTITWLDDTGEKYAYALNWDTKSLAGSLNASDCTRLEFIDCDNNSLTALTVTNDTRLGQIYIRNNQITSLDLSTNSGLSYLYCNGNKLTALDTTGAGNSLWEVQCYGNSLTSLTVSDNKALINLYCSENELTELNVNGLSALTTLACDDNALTTLTLTGCSALADLYCYTNALTSLTVDSCTNLGELYCDNNQLTSLDTSALTSLTDLTCSDNTLTSLKFGANVDTLDCGNCSLTSLDLSTLTALANLACPNNNLTSLDLSKNTLLEELYCDGNNLTALDLSKNTLLNNIICSKNRLSALDLSANTVLEELKCSNNRLSALDLSKNTLLGEIEMVGNPLKQIDANVNGSSVSLTAKDGGYVELYYDDYGPMLYATAVPVSPATFYNWTNGASVVAVTAKYDLPLSTAIDLDANFLQGKAVGLSCTKTDASVYGGADGSVTITATGGDCGIYDYSLGGAWQKTNVFTGLAAGNYTAAVRDAVNTANSAACSVTVGQPSHVGIVPAKKMPSKANAGTAITLTPPAAPRSYTLVSVTYSSSNPSVASVDASGNVSFLAGGKVSIITKSVYQMTDSKGKVKTKTTTVKKTVTVKQPVSSVALNMADTTVMRTQKVKLTAAVSPMTASNKKMTWKSSNPKISSVSSTGIVTAKSTGTAVITCTAKDGSGAAASCTVTVTPIQPTGLKLSKAVLVVKTGKSASLRATVMPRNTDFKTATFVSSNPAVATVDAKGKIKAIAPGTAIITATSANGLTASCTVTVK